MVCALWTSRLRLQLRACAGGVQPTARGGSGWRTAAGGANERELFRRGASNPRLQALQGVCAVEQGPGVRLQWDTEGMQDQGCVLRNVDGVSILPRRTHCVA